MQSRRNFIGKVASSLAGTLAASNVLGASERIRVGIIGPGERGKQILLEAVGCDNIECVGAADVYGKRLDEARGIAPGAKAYHDYRALLDDKSIDAVLVATPQHLHCEHFTAALDAGKHVYQEKTMAFSVAHAKKMRAAFQRAGRRTVQIGHQWTSTGQVADAVSFLNPELIGKITAIHGHMYRNTPHGKPMGLRIPRAVTMNGGLYLWKDGREVPDTMNVSMEQPEEILFSWDSGFGNDKLNVSEDVLGTDGTISRSQQIRYAPQKVNRPQGNEMMGQTRTEPRAHMQNFFDCIRSGKEPNCPFELGYRVAIACRMAVESYRQQRTVRWDAEKEEIV